MQEFITETWTEHTITFLLGLVILGAVSIFLNMQLSRIFQIRKAKYSFKVSGGRDTSALEEINAFEAEYGDTNELVTWLKLIGFALGPFCLCVALWFFVLADAHKKWAEPWEGTILHRYVETEGTLTSASLRYSMELEAADGSTFEKYSDDHDFIVGLDTGDCVTKAANDYEITRC